MALQVLEVLWAGRARAPRSKRAPLCRVRCGCGEEYSTRGFPHVVERRVSCTRCRALRFWERRRAALARAGVPNVRCEETSTACEDLDERERAWLGLR